MLNFNIGAKCCKIFSTACSCCKQKYKKKLEQGSFNSATFDVSSA